MQDEIHQRLRRLRLGAGFKTLKSFLAWSERQGYGSISYSRYSALERGDVDLTAADAKVICAALKVSADMLLFGAFSGVEMRGLTPKEREIVSNLAKGLMGLRADH